MLRTGDAAAAVKIRAMPFVRLWRLAFDALKDGARNDPTFRALLLLVLGLLGSGTIFYMLVEGWSLVDALYFSTIILTTVGLSETAPDSDLGKLFTTAFALVGIGVVVAFGASFAQLLIARAKANPPRYGRKREP
jgi:voltage-gated potassium channel